MTRLATVHQRPGYAERTPPDQLMHEGRVNSSPNTSPTIELLQGEMSRPSSELIREPMYRSDAMVLLWGK